jgi:hypothetical protein
VIPNARATILSLTFLILFVHPPTWSRDHPVDDGHAGMSMSMPLPADGESGKNFIEIGKRPKVRKLYLGLPAL